MGTSLLLQLVGHFNSMGPVKLSIVSSHNSSWEVEPKFNHGSLLGSFFRFFIQKGKKKKDQMHGDARSKVRKSPPSWEFHSHSSSSSATVWGTVHSTGLHYFIQLLLLLSKTLCIQQVINYCATAHTNTIDHSCHKFRLQWGKYNVLHF